MSYENKHGLTEYLHLTRSIVFICVSFLCYDDSRPRVMRSHLCPCLLAFHSTGKGALYIRIYRRYKLI